MDKPPNRIAQLYGYSVCLVAVLVFVFSIQSAATALISLRNPLAGPYASGFGSITSFEAYKATYDQPGPGQGYVTDAAGHTAGAQPKLSDAQLRARYEAVRADRLTSAHFESMRDISVSGLMVIISIVLFTAHWRWLRSLSR